MPTEPTPAPQAEPERPDVPAADAHDEAPGPAPETAPEVTFDDDEDDELAVGEVDEPLSDEPYSLVTRLSAEVFGTFALVLVTVGTALYTSLSGLGALGTALAAGFVLAGLYAAFAHVSGAHLNPAVSIASALAGRVRASDAALYVAGQVIAGVAAVAVIRITVPTGLPAALQFADLPTYLASVANGYDAGSPLSVLSTGQVTFGLVPALLVELIGAAVLAAVVLGSRPSARSALAVGLTYSAMLMVAIPVTNGGLNPARATGVAIMSIGADAATAMPQLWLFWVAPLIGGALAGLAKLALGRREQIVLAVDED